MTRRNTINKKKISIVDIIRQKLKSRHAPLILKNNIIYFLFKKYHYFNTAEIKSL